VIALALPGVPFVAALVGLLLPLRARRTAVALGVGGAAVALALAFVVPAGTAAYQVVDFGGLPVSAAVDVTEAARYVAVAVGVVALAVQVYSVAYLADDDRYAPYAAQVSLFTAAMLLVVVADDLVMLLVGWEVMGICSYLLIGHDRRLPEAPGAAVKAFLVTRAGDVGFLLGVAILGVGAHTFRISALHLAGLPAATLTTACLLLLAGVAGKSAQFPLHTWLPDAMAGPTPISALIHAATMVAAGVYVVARLYPLFAGAPAALAVLGVSAAVTMLLGALAATAQDDIKRVLAWSTVSQLGYMSGALAVGAVPAALFHLLTHAAFKALLFLAAGAVIHAVGSNLMSRMGGLRTGMPATFWSTTIGLGALVGVPPLAGFWSKDLIVASAQTRPGWVATLLYASMLATVAVTAWYATRLWLRTFFGEVPAGVHPHEPPAAMRWPVLLLAVPSALLGFVALAPGFLGGHLFHLDATVLMPLALVALGAAGAWWDWRAGLNVTVPAFARAFYLDEVQHTLVVRPVVALARAVRKVDEAVVDGAVESTGRTATALGRLLARAHRPGLPRYATAVAAGALLIGTAAVVAEALR